MQSVELVCGGEKQQQQNLIMCFVQFLSVQSEGRFDRIYDQMLHFPLSSSQCGNLHICRFKGSVHQDASVYPDQYPSAYHTLNNFVVHKDS